MNFGEKLQYLRKTKGLSQEQLAAQAAVSRQAVSKWELGAAMPDIGNILQISKLFGVTTDYLLDDGIEAVAAVDDQNAPPMEEKETIETTGPVRRKKSIGRIVLIVLAIYMTAFAAAIITQPPYLPSFANMPYFAMIATAVSIVSTIVWTRDRR